MKRIGPILVILAAYFLIKFSMGNLNQFSFFLDLGYKGPGVEHSLFLKGGCESESPSNYSFSQRSPAEPITPSHSTYSTPKIIPIQPCELIPFEKPKPIAEASPNLSKTILDEPKYERPEPPKPAIKAPNKTIVLESQETCPPSSSCSPACCIPPPCQTYNPWPLPKMISVRHMEGINEQEGTVTLATNYSTLAILFAPDYRPGHLLPMLDLRGHRFDKTFYAANAGIIGRLIPDSSNCYCKILGFNLYYDYQQSCLGYFQQAGFGLEILGNRWDIRGNLYVPFGPRKHQHSLDIDYPGGYVFHGDIYEYVTYAFNAEVGCYLYYGCDFSLYLAGGPYYISGRSCVDKTRGGEVRLRPQYSDYLAVDFSYRYDSLFESIWQAEITIYLPLYSFKGQCLKPCSFTDWQIYQPVSRFEVLPIYLRQSYYVNY